MICVQFTGCGGPPAVSPQSKDQSGPPTDNESFLDLFNGNWKLVSVRCDGLPTAGFPDALLDAGGPLELQVNYQGTRGKRVWSGFGCQLTVNFSSVVYTATDFSAVESDASCQGTCGAFATQCQAKGSSITYPYTLNGSQMTLEIKPTAGADDPCNAGWAKKVIFNYVKVN